MDSLLLALFQYGSRGTAGNGAGAGVAIVYLAFTVFLVVCQWKIYKKAGREGWEAIVPVYSAYVLLKIVGRPGWWLLLFLVPLANFVVILIVFIDLAKSFGKGAGYGLGLLFLGFIFLPMLAFGSAQYEGPAASSNVDHRRGRMDDHRQRARSRSAGEGEIR